MLQSLWYAILDSDSLDLNYFKSQQNPSYSNYKPSFSNLLNAVKWLFGGQIFCFLLYHLIKKLLLAITKGFLIWILKFQWIGEKKIFFFDNSQHSASPQEDIPLEFGEEVLMYSSLLVKITKGWNYSSLDDSF